MNLQEQLESMSGSRQEKRAEKYLSSVASEMIYLDREAKASGSTTGKMFDESRAGVLSSLASAMRTEYGDRILKRDGWKEPDRSPSEYAFQDQLKAEMAHSYKLASKQVHGSPISTMIGADFDKEPMRTPLEHKTVGVPVQCLMTGWALHSIVTLFCSTTDEKSGINELYLRERSDIALREMGILSSA